MKKYIFLGSVFLILAPLASAASTPWMRRHPDVSRKYLERWEKHHRWLTPAREGKLLFQNGNIARARPQLERALAEGSEDGRLFYELGYCYQSEGDNQQAIDCYRKAVEKLSRQFPDHLYLFNAHYLLGTLYEEMGWEADALREYDQARKIHPRNPILYYCQARIWLRQGDDEKAISEVKKALEYQPQLATSHFLLGLLYLRKDDLETARKHLREAIRGGEESGSAYYCLGCISLREGKLEEAVDCFNKALHNNPEQIEARISLANIFYEQNNLPVAKRYFEELARLKPDSARWHYNLGVINREMGNEAAAEENFQNARNLNPDLMVADKITEGLPATNAYARGNLDQARRLYKLALSEDSFSIPVRYNLAIVYTELGETGPAIREYQRLLRIQPNYPPAHLNLGILAYDQDRRSPSAAHHLRRYLQLRPEAKEADLIKRYLHEIRGW